MGVGGTVWRDAPALQRLLLPLPDERIVLGLSDGLEGVVGGRRSCRWDQQLEEAS
eukprot:gene5042-3600_t